MKGIDGTRRAEWYANRVEAMRAHIPSAPTDADPEWRQAAHFLTKNREAIVKSYVELTKDHNVPTSECVIVAPAIEVGAVRPGGLFHGMEVRPEHSATEYRVVWEYPR